MKIEQLIVQYLYNNKKVTLQDIGVFYLSPNVSIPTDHEKDAILPDNAITFEYNTKAVQDNDLIDFIVKQTRKIKPLATSDLESFTILGRQFMNIGKPLPIEGLGILQKTQSGEYEFIQGHTVNPRLEPIPALLKEKHKEEIVFTTPGRKQNNNTAIWAAVIIFILLAATAAFYFLVKTKKDKKSEQAVIQNTDTLRPKTDTVMNYAAPVKDSPVKVVVPGVQAQPFNIIVKEYETSEAAGQAYIKFSNLGLKLMGRSRDSLRYKLGISFYNPISDTTHLKDSLRHLFGGKPYVEKN